MAQVILPHQKEILEKAHHNLTKHNRVYLALHAGAGKTFMALALAKLVQVSEVFVVAPKVLHTPWKQEVAKHDILDGIVVHTVTYESLDHKQLPKDAVVIFDECHSRLATMQTKRTKNYMKTVRGVEGLRRIYLSATPFSKPIQMFPILKTEYICDNWFKYAKEFCDAKRTPFGWDTTGATNMPALRTLLSVEKEFFVFSDYTAKSGAIQEIIVAEDVNDTDERFGGVTTEQIHSFLKKPSTLIPFEEYSLYRKETGERKLPYLAKYIQSLPANDTRIVFMHHIDLANELADVLGSAKTVNGGNSQKNNDKAIADFKAGKINTLILSLSSAAEGLNITESSHVVFGELPWNAYQIYQAKKRVDRYGQKKQVTITFFVMPDSLDHSLAKTVSNKTFNIEAFIGTEFV